MKFLITFGARLLRPRARYSTSSSAQSNFETFNAEEGKKFERMSESWWDPEGQLKELHSMNKLRVPLVRDGLINPSSVDCPTPLKNLEILDVGCGGGILSEPLGRLGASIVGLDPGLENIKVASSHLKLCPELLGKVEYECSTIEQFLEKNPNKRFDGVISSETIEHVENPDTFIRLMGQCVKPEGSLFLTTLNRTMESWAGAIIAWEYVLRRLPIGTHQWNKFLTPKEVQGMLSSNGFRVKLVHGMCYNPLLNKWSWSNSTAINYCIHAVKV